MTENIFDQYDSDEDTLVIAPPRATGTNAFDAFDDDPVEPNPAKQTVSPSVPPQDNWYKPLADQKSQQTARDSARVLTEAERKSFNFQQPQTEEDASFWGSLEHGLGNRNLEAYADTLEHLADMSDDPSYAQSYRDWSGSLRRTVQEDGSTYKPVFQSYRQINGLADAWGYVKEVAGEQIGIQIPGIVGAIGGGYLGQKAGAPLGKFGRVTGGVTGATAGALSGMIHHHVSEMRRALQGEKVEGDDLVKYTNYGTMVLAGLDLAFPVVAGMKFNGVARQAIARKVALQLAKGGTLRAPSEFIKRFGKEIVKDAILLEVPTEIAQEAVTTFVPPEVAGREVTDEEIQRFITETVPETAFRTAIGAGAMTAPGSAVQARTDVKAGQEIIDRDLALEAQLFDQERQVARETKEDRLDVESPVQKEDASRFQRRGERPTETPSESVVQFIRERGGIQPSGEMDVMDAGRYPGLISNQGMTPDQAREALVEAGYLTETGADETAVTTPNDVYDLLDRAIRGERVVPVAEQAYETERQAAVEAYELDRELEAAEQNYVLPALAELDQEIGSPILSEAYSRLSNDDKAELIERVSRAEEDISDVLESIAIRNEDAPTIAAMAIRRGLNDEQIAQVRELIAQQSPELAAGFDELIASLPKQRQSRARKPAAPVSKAGRNVISRLESIGKQAELRSAVDELAPTLKADEWKSVAYEVTRRNFQSGKQAREAVLQRMSDKLLMDERVEGVKRLFGRDEQAAAPRRKEPGSTLTDFARASSASEIAERFNILQEDVASLLGRDAFTGEAKTIVERLASKAAEGNKHVLNNDWDALGQVVGDMAADAATLTELDARPEARLITQWVDTASRLAREGNIPVPERDEVNPQQLRRQFADILNSRTPRSKWASELGIDEAALEPLIEEAIRKGFLRRDKNGNVRRVPKSQRSGSFAAMAIPENLPETMPGEGDVALTPEAEEVWPEAKAAINRAASQILPDAVNIDVRDNIAIATLRKEDQMLALREEAAFRRWFGDSKVVDENGEPLVVYHGTDANMSGDFAFEVGRKTARYVLFSEFEVEGQGVFFSPNPNDAKEFGRNVGSFYLRMENPLPHNRDLFSSRPSDGRTKEQQVKERQDLSYILEPMIKLDENGDGSLELMVQRYDLSAEEIEDGSWIGYLLTVNPDSGTLSVDWESLDNPDVVKRMKERGYDGAIVSERDSQSGISYFVVEPTQIKSVNNRGTFDPTDPRISYALRKTKPSESAIDEDASENRVDTGREGLETGEGQPSPGGVAVEGEGLQAPPSDDLAAGLPDRALARIIRQESASLDADGNIIAGRPSRQAKASGKGGEDVQIQRAGKAEPFDISGFDGRVKAEKLNDRDAREGNLARLTYEVREPGSKSAIPLGEMEITQRSDGAWEVGYVEIRAPRNGIATKLYDAVEKDLGIRMSPSGVLSESGHAFWQSRSPASVQWHVKTPTFTDEAGKMYFSPRKITDEMDRIGRELKTLSTGAGWAMKLSPAERETFRKAYVKERGQLLALYGSLPLEARARNVRDQMFALRAFHGSPHDFDRFDMSRIGTGEGAQAFGHGLYFAENELTAQAYRRQLAGPERYWLNGKELPESANPFAINQYAQMKMDGDRAGLAAEEKRLAASVQALQEQIAANNYDNFVFREVDQLDLRTVQDLLAILKQIVEGKVTRDLPGKLYEVEIDVEPEQLLDWDLPLSKQDEKIKAAIEKSIGPKANDPLFRRMFLDQGKADVAYGALVGILGSPDAASAALREAGIPGIRFLDQGSRGTSEGTRNIVIFDDSLVKITKKNGKPVTGEERQGVIDEMMAMRRMPPATEPQALGQTVADRYDPRTMSISIAMRAVEAEAKAKGVSTKQEAVRVLRHETIEFFKAMGLFTEKEWNVLKSAAKRNGWVETTGVREAYESVYKGGMSEADLSDLLVKEAIAEQYSEFHLNKKQFKGKVAEVFQRIKDFIDRVANWMKGEGFQVWGDVFQSIDQGEFKARFEEAFPEMAPQPATGARAIQATAGRIADSPVRAPSAGIEQPTQSLADLVNAFNRALGLTVRQGRLDPGLKRRASMAGQDVRGQTSMETGVIRLRVPNEIDTLAHEGGHALENRFKGDLEAIKQAHAAELTPLASPGPDALSEGFAEWFRRYVTNPAASKRTAPGFEQDFEDFLDAQDPVMLASLQSIRDGYQEWIKAPSGGAVASSIATTVAPGSTKEIIREFREEGLRNTFQNWTDRIYTAVFDDLHPMRLAVDGLLEIAKKNVKPSLRKNLDVKATDNAYKLLRLARDGYAAGHMDLLHGVHDYKSITPTGPSLRDAIATAFGGFDKSQWNEEISTNFGAYLTSRRMMQEWARFQNGDITAPPDKFSLADHQQAIKDFEAKYPGFAQGAQQVHEYLNNMLRKKRDAGLITSELYDELVGRQDYVPVMRDMSDRGGVEGRSAARKDKYSIISRFRGSQRDVINPLESIAKDSYETAMIIARNDALKALDALARAAGPDGGRFAERIPAREMKATQVNVQEAIKAASRDAGIDPADMQIMLQAVDDQLGDNTVAQIWRAGEISEKGEAIVYLWENGERIPIRLADGKFGHDMLHAVTGLNREAADWWVNLLSLPSTGLRIGVTASLDFIGANFLRDQVSAWVLTRDFVPFYDGARGIYNDLNMSDVSRIYSRVGGIMGGANVAAQHESRIKREILQLRRKGIKFTLNPFTRDFWRMTEFSETGTRLAVFEKAFDRAKTDGLTDWESAIEASFIARDYIDFGRRGSRMLAARRLVPFMNAALQGLDRGIRGLRGRVDADKVLRTVISPYIKSRTGQPLSEVEQGNKKQAAQAWGYMVALGMIGLGLSLLYRDDEEWEEISDYIKATHWLIRLDGQWVRIPKPFELAFFSNLVERTFDYVVKDDPTAVSRFVDGLLEITVPPHSIPGVAVTTELAADYNFFTGRPIVGPFLKTLPPELQFNAYASEFSKYLGKQVGISPAYIDHFITGFGASYGREFVNASDMFMPALGQATDGLFGLPTQPVADPAVNDYFFVRRFTTDPTRGSTSVRQFWDMMGMENGTFTQAANGYRHLVDKVRDAKGAQEFLDRLPDEERAYALLKAGNSGNRSKYRRLHPLERAKEIVSVTGGMKKEINLNRLYKGGDGKQIELTPQQMRTVSDLMSDISMREARNALIALKVRGWEQKSPIEVDTVYEEMKAAAPEVHKELVDRLKSKKLPSYQDVVKGWPIARERILEDGQKAIISDLYRRDFSIGEGAPLQ